MPAEVLQSEIAATAAATASSVAADLRALGARLAAALEAAGAGASSVPVHPLPRPTGMPVLDAAQVAGGLRLRAPALAFLGRGYREHRAGRELRRQAGPALAAALAAYRRSLERWRRGFLGDLRQVFEASADPLRGSERHKAVDPAEAPGPAEAPQPSEAREPTGSPAAGGATAGREAVP